MVKSRRNLTPPRGLPSGEVHATRRGGARLEVSARVKLRSASGVLEGWALNVGRGGVRVILEERVEPGSDYEVTLLDTPCVEGAPDASTQMGRVVWVQDEPDGVVAGLEFLSDADKSAKSY